MVTVKVGDMFQSKAQTWVNPVNCVGVMGKGVALEFKRRFPDMYEDYVRRCRAGEVKLGRPYLYKRVDTPWILNFPTKDDWRSVSRLDMIEEGLRSLEEQYREWGIASLAVPALGCGHGQLEWRVVGLTIYRYLQRLNIPVEIYAPFETPRIAPGWIAVVQILEYLEREPCYPPVDRTSIQQIAYFASESGIPVDLRFEKGSDGPHTEEVQQKIAALVNNGLIREERLGSVVAVRVGPTFLDARRAYEGDITTWGAAIERIVDLFMRMNIQRAAVAATVHYAAQELQRKQGRVPAETAIVQAVMEWTGRRHPPLDPIEVAMTTRNLNLLGWIRAMPSEDLPVSDEEGVYA